MKYDLKTPCKNCPFRTDKSAIRFSCRERAEEIEESAYRNGFPCHLSAHNTSDEDEENGGYEATETSQHCIGFIIMMINDGYDAWPGVDNDADIVERITERIARNAPVFQSVEEYLKANEEKKKGVRK